MLHRSRLVCVCLIALLAIGFGRSLFAAAVGTLSVTSTDYTGMTKYTLAWTSSAGGAVSGNPFSIRKGHLVQVKFVPGPGGTQPSSGYSVTLIDADGVDQLNGQASSLSNTTASLLVFNPRIVNDATETFDLVVANAGNAKTGTVYVWVE